MRIEWVWTKRESIEKWKNNITPEEVGRIILIRWRAKMWFAKIVLQNR